MAGKSALLVVDIQHDFLPGGTLGVREGDRVVPVLNEYIHRFRHELMPVFASRDWHPPLTKHFNTQGGPWPPHCVQGTPGAEFAPGHKLPPHTIVLSKGMDPNEDSYSVFHAEGPGRRHFGDLLREQGVTHLYIGGLATDYCVRATVLDAIAQGFQVTVLEDAIRGVNEEDSRRAIAEMKKAGAKFITLSELPILDVKAATKKH